MTAAAPRIVVGYDASPDADAALAWAAGNAAPGDELSVVIVGTAMDPVLGDHRAAMDRVVEQWRSDAEERLSGLGLRPTSVEVRHGPVVPTLLQAAADASLLVLGSRGHALATGTFGGSVSQHVARHASCPVIVVRPPHTTSTPRIVVGIDGSPESVRALRFACERARRTGDSVTAIHAHFSPLAHVLTFDGAQSPIADRQLAEGERLATELCRASIEEFPDLEIEAESVPVRPAQALVDASGAATLVVVGSRGRDAFAEMLLGSVSQHVLSHARCPVAVVR